MQFQSLIDARDWSHTRAQTEAVTFLGNTAEQYSARNLYTIPGLDYVSHEDIIPYSTKETIPIQHELFDRFLGSKVIDEENGIVGFEPQSPLIHWQKKNHPWLALSDVHKETTENIRVTVTPFYMGYRDNSGSNTYWVRLDFQLNLEDPYQFNKRDNLLKDLFSEHEGNFV